MRLAPPAVLARCPLFATLADDDLAALATIALPRHYTAGQTLFLAGERPAGLHVVTGGAVKVFVLSPATGREVVLSVEHPYQTVAELPSFDGDPYPAHAAAVGDAETLLLAQAGLDRLLGERPRLARHLLRTLGRRLRRLVELVERISFQEVIQRLAADLRDRGDAGVPFELETNAVIAARLGTVPELVSRNLARLVQIGAVRTEGRRVMAIDDAALRALAEDARR